LRAGRYITERPRLIAVAEDRKSPALQDAIHENADDIPIRVADVLALPVDVVRTEDDGVQPEHFAGGAQVELHRILGDAVGILRLGNQILGHGQLVAAIDRDRGGKDEALDVVVHGGIDQVHAADQVVLVIEPANKMAQPLGGIGCQVKNVVELPSGKQGRDQLPVQDAAPDKFGLRIHVVRESTRQIVERHNVIPAGDELVRDMRTHETRRARHEDGAGLRHAGRSC
jgi:hypothetical protein